MKRQKRDRLERAHSQGYKAGLAGRLINKSTLNLNGWVAGERPLKTVICSKLNIGTLFTQKSPIKGLFCTCYFVS